MILLLLFALFAFLALAAMAAAALAVFALSAAALGVVFYTAVRLLLAGASMLASIRASTRRR